MNATTSAPDGPPQAVQAQPHTSKDTAMTITNDRLAEIRDLSVDSCSADAPYNPDVWALENARGDLLAEVDHLNKAVEKLQRDLANEEARSSQVLGERDDMEKLLDKFAYAIAPEEVIGEHSSGNDPWLNALDLVTPASEVETLRAQRDRLLALHEYDELIFGGFYCVHCTPDDADDPDDNVYWPCPSLRAVGVDNDEGNAIILARRAEIARQAAQEAGAR